MTKTNFSCNSCNYSTRNKYDWNKHILTKKHTRNASIKNGTIQLSFNPSIEESIQNKKNIHVYVIKYTNIIQDCLDIKLNVN